MVTERRRECANVEIEARSCLKVSRDEAKSIVQI